MSRVARFVRGSRSGALWRRTDEEPASWWTEALGRPPAVYGERIAEWEGRPLRRWDPSRSKLAAALVRGWTDPLPASGQRWLYLGSASGTTASHIADLLGVDGALYAVEKSVRPFTQLLRLSERYPNIGPILADARDPADYLGLVPPVDGMYVDIAQPDQVSITLHNARLFLRRDGALLLALKTASMGRERAPREHLHAAEEELSGDVRLEATEPLAPFHRQHYLIGGRAVQRLFREAGPMARAAPTPRPVRPAGRRR